MRILFGLGMVLVGIFVGVYVGVWICFIGGIVDIVNEIKAPSVDAMNIAIGVAKIIFAQFAGGISAMLFVGPGIAIIKE